MKKDKKQVVSIHADIAELAMNLIIHKNDSQWIESFATTLAHRTGENEYALKLISEAQEFINESSEKGKAGAKARWEKERMQNDASACDGIANALPEQCKRNASAMQTHDQNRTDQISTEQIKEENKENILSPAQNSQADKSKKFVKPTIQEIADYCNEKHYAIDADYFWNFYEARGWKMGSTPIKNWKSCIATWIKRDPELKKQPEVKQEEEQTKYKNGVIFDTDDDYI